MLVLEVRKGDFQIIQELAGLTDYTQIVEPSHLDGEALIQLLVEVNKVTAPLVAEIILAHLNSNKIKIKKGGVCITMLLTKRSLKKAELVKELLKMGEDEQKKDVKDEPHD